MTEYRTREQFNEIIDSAVNGNWQQARDEVAKYGFYATDLVKAYDNLVDEFGLIAYFDAKDLCHLIPDFRNAK